MIWDGVEKRKRVRANLPCRIIIHTPGKEIIDAVTNNISEGGVGVTLKKELKSNTPVELEIYEILMDKPISCKGVIKWVNSTQTTEWKGDAFFYMGIEFSEINNRDVLAIRNLVRFSVPERE
ncbi:PilZ domain-containing protein [Candidatus Omnitrophota bacterium]